jgi:hypothetical protein
VINWPRAFNTLGVDELFFFGLDLMGLDIGLSFLLLEVLLVIGLPEQNSSNYVLAD